MPNTTTSAKIGKPPNNTRDYNIIRGIYRHYGITTLDPSLGYALAAKPPENAVHESKQPAIIADMVIVMMAITFPVAARLWVRGRGTQTKTGWDDWALCVAAVLGVVYSTLQILVVIDAGGGTHIWEHTYDDYQLFAYYLNVCRLLYYPTVGIINISITLLIRRLVERAYRAWRVFTDIFLGTLVAYVLLAVFWNIFICNPARAVWDREFAGSLAEPAICGNEDVSARTLSIVHVVQSVLLLATPMIILWSVPIGRAKKIRLFVIWAVGGLAVTGGLLQQIQPLKLNDALWEYTFITRWTTIDISMGILTASLPVLDSAIMRCWQAPKPALSLPNGDGENSKGTSRTSPETIIPGPKRTNADSFHDTAGRDYDVEMGVQQTCLQENDSNHSIQDTPGNNATQGIRMV
ncbi:hypothetical protein LZ32DRAFT_625980 [Colletotrichum eremochloae]|nr:hypothetical protein LZ32DRAFT_625980 [Colletotrichum eremochloae]